MRKHLNIPHGGLLDHPLRHCPRFFTADQRYRRYFKPIVADHSSKSLSIEGLVKLLPLPTTIILYSRPRYAFSFYKADSRFNAIRS